MDYLYSLVFTSRQPTQIALRIKSKKNSMTPRSTGTNSSLSWRTWTKSSLMRLRDRKYDFLHPLRIFRNKISNVSADKMTRPVKTQGKLLCILHEM